MSEPSNEMFNIARIEQQLEALGICQFRIFISSRKWWRTKHELYAFFPPKNIKMNQIMIYPSNNNSTKWT